MAEPLNLLVLMTDEQRRDTLAAYGNTHIQMPHLDALARRSCVFDDAHCVDPICTPSRGCLQTGLMPWANGAVANNVPLHDDARCLPELLSEPARDARRVEYHGKWHLGDELYPQHGHERMRSIEDLYFEHFSDDRDPADRSDYHHHLLAEGFTTGTDDVFARHFAARLPERYSKPRFLADGACEFLRQHRGRPWMLTVSMLEPHMPFHGPRDGQYDPDDVPMFAGYDHDPDPADVPEAVRQRLAKYRENGFEGHDLTTDAGWRTLTARYLGLCSQIDHHLGRILASLEQTGQADRTLVVYTSDHGEFMGSHRLLEKNLPYRAATAVPLMIRLPGQIAPLRVNGPVSQIDLVPTLLESMGQSVDADLHGRSLAGLLHDGVASGAAEVDATGDASPCVVVQHERTRSLISPDGWRYTTWLNTGERELYDLTADPHETRNLANHPTRRERLEQMHQRLTQWQRGIDDPATLPGEPTTGGTLA
jgi:arylsulfatase A-like enzyme